MPFVALSIVDHVGPVQRFADRYGLTEPVAVAKGDVLTPLGVHGVPAVAILRDGRVVALASTSVSAAELDAAVGQWRPSR